MSTINLSFPLSVLDMKIISYFHTTCQALSYLSVNLLIFLDKQPLHQQIT